jgi:hypothetical protein
MESFPKKKIEKRTGLGTAVRSAMAGMAMLGGVAAAENMHGQTKGPDVQHEHVETFDLNKEIDAFLISIGHLPTHSQLGPQIIESRVNLQLRGLMLSASQKIPHFASSGPSHIEGTVGIENALQTKPVRDALLKKLETYSDDDPRIKALHTELKILATFDSQDQKSLKKMEQELPAPEHTPIPKNTGKTPEENKNAVHKGASSSTSNF